MKTKIPIDILKQIIVDILIERSNVEEVAASEKDIKEINMGVESSREHGAAELHTTACASRILADDVSEGIISVKEAIEEVLSLAEVKEVRTRCEAYVKNNDFILKR